MSHAKWATRIRQSRQIFISTYYERNVLRRQRKWVSDCSAKRRLLTETL